MEQDRGAGGREEEVERWTEEGIGDGQGAETSGRRKKRRGELREGDLDERAAVTEEEEDEQGSQGGGWDTLLNIDKPAPILMP